MLLLLFVIIGIAESVIGIFYGYDIYCFIFYNRLRN